MSNSNKYILDLVKKQLAICPMTTAIRLYSISQNRTWLSTICILLFFAFPVFSFSQCEYSYLPGEVVMDNSSGRIYMFRKIEQEKVTFRVNSIDPQVHLNMPYTKPCNEINLIKPFFEQGDFIHTWEGEKYAVHAYQPRWDTDDPQWITIIREKENQIAHETVRLKWQWIERIEKKQ